MRKERILKMQMPEIKSMTLREKLGQLLIVRMSDLLMDADSSYTKLRAPEEAAQIMEKNQFGGIWLHGALEVNHINQIYRENIHFTPDSLKTWYEEVRKNVKIPVIAAADAFGPETAEGYSVYPEGLAVGASSDANSAFELGQCVARELGYAGLDWLWGPIGDHYGRRTFGVDRPFSNKADDLIRCNIDYIKGIHSMNMAATVKHFPGVDPRETRDSHIVTTFIKTSMEEWKQDQGRIFQEIIDAGVDAVMSVATAFPAADDTMVDGRYLPGGLSYNILTKLLKEEMGFQGVVITDDVNMGGFTSFYSGGRLYAEFIKAGHDMLLGVRADAVDLLEKEVEKGTVSMERIDDAVRRVLMLKKKVGLFDRGYRQPDYTIQEAVAQTEKMTRKLAENSLTLVRDRNNRLPFNKEEVKRVAIVCYTHGEFVFEQLNAMKEEFEAHGAEVTMKRRLNSFEEAKEVADTCDLIIYVGHIAMHCPKGALSFYGDEFWALRHAFVYGAEKSVGYATGYPHIHYDFMDDAQIFVNAYTTAGAMQKAFVQGLYGEIPFVGKTPVELD